MIDNYLLLEQEIEEISKINNVINILTWDTAVNMPIGSVETRSDEISLLGSIARSKLQSSKIADLINAAEHEKNNLDSWQATNLKEIKKQVRVIGSIDNKLYARYITASTKCELIWRKARAENDFGLLKAYMEDVLICVKEIASNKASSMGCSKYDALIDDYDPDRQANEIKNIFEVLKKGLPEIIGTVIDKQKSYDLIKIKPIEVDLQKRIVKKIMHVIGFDFTRGRLDESTHPFCGGTSFDVRITNRYQEEDFLSGIMNIIHETGHALYEQHLPTRYKNQPVGKAKGMAIHESQSLFMEMQIGRSKDFCTFLSKLLEDEFNLTGIEYSADNLYKLSTRVTPSLIRVDADEVTYPMHVILRFEIEELLINNEIGLHELPAIWNEKMYRYLGVRPKSDKEGCLQDIHWPSGWFGYFPAYTLGAIIASMLGSTLDNTVMSEVAKGNFYNINEFLNKKIWGMGSLKDTNNLIKEAVGEGTVNPNIFLAYLENKYKE